MIDLNTENFGVLRKKKVNFVVLPWGATEPHNYHLPYLTDSLLASKVAERSIRLMDFKYRDSIALFPSVNFGSQNPGQTDYPCCIHYSQETQKGILKDMVISLISQKIFKMVIVNGHMGNCFKGIIRDLKQYYPEFDIFVINYLEIEKEKQLEIFENKEDHAGEIETSLMMHLYPDLVDLSIAGSGENLGFEIEALEKPGIWTPRNWRKVSIDSGVGNPLSSTPEKGEKYFEVVCKYISEFFTDLLCKDVYRNKSLSIISDDSNYSPAPFGKDSIFKRSETIMNITKEHTHTPDQLTLRDVVKDLEELSEDDSKLFEKLENSTLSEEQKLKIFFSSDDERKYYEGLEEIEQQEKAFENMVNQNLLDAMKSRRFTLKTNSDMLASVVTGESQYDDLDGQYNPDFKKNIGDDSYKKDKENEIINNKIHNRFRELFELWGLSDNSDLESFIKALNEFLEESEEDRKLWDSINSIEFLPERDKLISFYEKSIKLLEEKTTDPIFKIQKKACDSVLKIQKAAEENKKED